jgi:transposase
MSTPNASLDLDSKFLGALPITNHFLTRLHVEPLLEQRLPPPDSRSRIFVVRVLMALLRCLIVCRVPLYSVAEWASSILPRLLGLTTDQASVLNDDRIGRALDDLFESDRQALLTDFVLGMVKEFRVNLEELHNDSTSLTFQGGYPEADGHKVWGQETHRITFGHNKDHRPDLKQLLWILTISSDGAVPVHFKVDHGNVEDSTTHIETWNVLRRLVGSPNFLYVADCKLCTSENLRYIDSQHGSFITDLPGNRKENDRFREWLATHDAPWQDIAQFERSGQSDPDIIRALNSPIPETNGFQLIWFYSSHKCRRDAEKRQKAILRALQEMEKLEEKLQRPRCRIKTARTLRKAADQILAEAGASRWIDYTVERIHQITKQQEQRKHPAAPLRVRQESRWRFRLSWHTRVDALGVDSKSDGILPLVTNRQDLSTLQVYTCYHCNQPMVEKRHDLLKNTLQVTPAFLHSVRRLEAFLFLEYLAITVHALIERQLRMNMAERNIEQIPLYPEARECKAPTTSRLFDVFEHVQVHILFRHGHRIRTFQPQLTPLQCNLLDLLGISPISYFS